jgi:hypothetical protein
LREPLEVREPDLDERPNVLLEPRLAGDRERLLVALTRLVGAHSLLQAVVTGHEELLDPLAGGALRTRVSIAHAAEPLQGTRPR